MGKKSKNYNSKRSIIEDIDRELKAEARIPRYKLLSPDEGKRLYYIKNQLAVGGTFIVVLLSAMFLILSFWLPILRTIVIPITVILGGMATMTSGLIARLSKPDWNPSMTMPYQTKVFRDDMYAFLLMLLGLAEVIGGIIAVMEYFRG